MLKKTLTVILLLAISVWASPGTSLAAHMTVPGGFATIQAAVDAAADGDTITVGPGNYTENVTVTRPVTLESASGPAATTVTAADPSRPVFEVTSSAGVAIRGFTATGSRKAGLVARGLSGARIEENVFTANNNGLMVYNATGSTIEGNAAEANDLYGIYMESSTNNVVRGNTANRNKDRGIFLTFSHENIIDDNKANLNTWNGITLWESNNNVITENLTLRNTYGVVIGNSHGNLQSGNTTIPNIYIILPILLMYLGILTYLGQKRLLTSIYGKK